MSAARDEVDETVARRVRLLASAGLSRLQGRVANASALATSIGASFDGRAFETGPSSFSPTDACNGLADLLSSMWDEAGELQEEIDAIVRMDTNSAQAEG